MCLYFPLFRNISRFNEITPKDIFEQLKNQNTELKNYLDTKLAKISTSKQNEALQEVKKLKESTEINKVIKFNISSI